MEEILEESPILNGESINLLVGPEVMDLMANPRFRTHWNNLLESCSWATIFQSPEFVIEWTQIFHDGNIPLLVYSHSKGKLDGLLTLTQSRQGGVITGAGKSDAHYHTWISLEHNKISFIKEALHLLRRKFQKQQILFTNLPSNAPIDWIVADPKWRKCCDLKPLNRPFVILNPPEVNGLVQKKQFRQNVNRLKRQGDLRLEKITETNRFIFLLDELALQYDFRQWAIYNRHPFKSNPLKKTFFIRLFQQKLLNVTVLWLNDQIIGSIVGSVGIRGWVHGAGINTQCPRYAKFSPGLLNFIMYAKHLSQEEYKFLDLSTGAFSYKDRLASSSDTVYRLVISPRPNNTIKKRAVNTLQDFLMEGMDKMNIDLKKIKGTILKNRLLAKEKLILVKNHGIHYWLKNSISKMVNSKTNTYTIKENGSVLSVKNGLNINMNCTKDFLDFEPNGSLLTKWEFLFDCMKRMEKGEISFTWTSKDKLMALIWLRENLSKEDKTNPEPSNQNISVLYGLYVHQDGLKDLGLFLSIVKEKAYDSKPKQNLVISAEINLTPYCPELEIVHL